MGITEEQLTELHSTVITKKEHLWTNHQERDMMPHAIAVFRTRGVVELPLEAAMSDYQAVVDKVSGAAISVMEEGGEPQKAVIEACTRLLQDSMRLHLNGFLESLMRGQVPQLVQAGDRLESVTVWSDAYMQDLELDEGQEPPTVTRGELEQAFITDPTTNVFEVAITNHFEDDLVGGCTHSVIHTPYTIGDGGVLRWGEPKHRLDVDDEGAIAKCIVPYIGKEVAS